MTTPSITFRLGPHTYTALLPTPSLALLPQPLTTHTLTLSGGVLSLPGGSVSLATNGVVPMSSAPESAMGQMTTTMVAAVAKVTVGTRVVTAIVTGFASQGGGGGSWVVQGQTLVTSKSEGLVVGGERTVGWGTTTLTRAVAVPTTTTTVGRGGGGAVAGGGGGGSGSGSGSGGSRYQMGTRMFSVEGGGRVGGQVVERTSVSGERPTGVASGEEEEDEEEEDGEGGGRRGSEGLAMTTAMVTETETETERETTTVMVTALPTRMGPVTGRGGRVDVKRKVVGLGVLMSVLVSVVGR